MEKALQMRIENANTFGNLTRKKEDKGVKSLYESEKTLKDIRKAFKNAPAPRKKVSNFAIVEALYDDITKMRKEGYYWDQIAELMSDFIKLEPSTLRRYYGEVKKGEKI